MKLVYRQSTQIIQKQRIQIQHNRIKNPNWQEATSWLYQAWPRMWTRERLRTTGNPASGQSGIRTREAYCESYALTTWPALGGGGGALFWSLPRVCLCLGASQPILIPLKRLAFVKRKPAKWEVEACGFLFFSGGGGVGSKRYVCMYTVAGEPSKEGVCLLQSMRMEGVTVYTCTVLKGLLSHQSASFR